MVLINVRFESNHCMQVEAEDDWTVAQVKQQLQVKYNVPAADCRFVFLGRELADDVLIKDCNLGSQSLLHMVRGRQRSHKVQNAGLNELTAIREELAATSLGPMDSLASISTEDGEVPHFYIYCKNVCHDIKPGKLRLRCALCKQGSFLLDKDPDSWEDVLQPGCMSGVCQEQACPGNMAEFYFRCAGHDGEADDTAVALDLIHTNTRHIPCITCTDVMSPVVVFPCEAGHTMCLDCFRIYCTTKLNDRDFTEHDTVGYSLGCPAGCENSFIREAHHFRVLGNEQYDRYQRFGTEEYILKMGGVLCPRPGCGSGLLPDPGVSRVICLQGCGFVFCRHCKEAVHNGDCSAPEPLPLTLQQGYQVDEDNALRARWEEDSKRTIEATTKRCPGCKAPTEKIDGCMHMTCSRCHYEWCWVCRVEWNRDCQGDHWFG